MSSATLQDDPSVESLFNVAETETLALFDTDGRTHMKPTHKRSAGRAVQRRAPRASCVRSFVRQYKQAPEETAMRVMRDALAVTKPIWMVGDSAYDTIEWHDPCGQQVVVPVAPHNARNTDDPKDIEYRIEERIETHSEDVQPKQSTLDETYNRRTGVERTNESGKNCGLGRAFARGRVHARAQVFLALCLRLVVAITNYERGDNPGSTIITV